MDESKLNAPDNAPETESPQDKPKRDFLFMATGAVAALGAVAISRPLLGHMSPAGDSAGVVGLNVDLSKLDEGMEMRVTYRNRPISIRHRTPAEIAAARADDGAEMIDRQTDLDRLRPKPDGSYDPRFLIFNRVCTHFGCVVISKAGDFDGFYCPCHGSHFDTSGRVRKGPAPRNLDIPPYNWTSETSITLREATVYDRLEAK